MTMRLPLLTVIVAFTGFFSTVLGQVTTPAKSGTQFFPLSEVREGLRGTARTVFSGASSEEFNVEILGIATGAIGPKQDMIIGRLSGGKADRTFVFAGMSGSPVYIDGKLVGAISYSFPFSKEPICGITPIQQMIDIFEQRQPARARSNEPRTVSFAELAAATALKPELPIIQANGYLMTSSPAMAAVAGQTFQPIATPVAFSGFSAETLKMFAPQLTQAGLLPVAAAGGAARITPLKTPDDTTLLGGDSVSMQLTRGDFSLMASGTVTLREGDRIYAFGHPFLSLGSSDLPMSESHVVTVIPNINNSFKLAVPDSMVGSMKQDRATGVFGKLGEAPKMIPVEIEHETSRGQLETFKYEIVRDEFLSPLLMNITIYNVLTSNERSLGEATVEMAGEISIKGQESVRVSVRLGGMQSMQFAPLTVAIPMNTLMKSNFDALEITGIKLRIKTSDGARAAVIERLAVDRTRVAAGDTVELQAFVRTDSGQTFMQKIPFTIPSGTPAGAVALTLGDGNTIQSTSAVQQFTPKTPSELISVINNLRRSDRLYLQAVRTTNGAVIGASELPNLPPSMLATLNNDRVAGGFKPTVQSVVAEKEIPPADFIITGQQTLTIEIIK